MSQSNPDNLEKYRGTTGAEVKTTDVSGDNHPLKKELGNSDDAKERIYDAKIAGERFVQFYDDTAAAIREYLSNAETACIRRARNELLDAGFTEGEIPNETTEMIEMAKEEVGYEPLIEVTYNRKSDETRLVIEDNGIGISVEEYQVLQRIGYSTSHTEGGRLGNFGMGFMSGFQLTSVNGVFKMKTKSYLTDEAYSTAEYVANCEFLDTEPDEYGTRFEFPGFGEEAKSINIPDKVEEFVDGMVITVLYRDFDESGQETNRSDDFLPTRMEDDYNDDATVLIYEDEFFKAVMSPEYANNRRGVLTYNISMPIRRNEDAFGSDNKFEAPWQWDYRGKREDGPIVHCPSDPSIEGLIPKEDTKYDGLMDNLTEKCIPMSEVPDDAIVMPEPASSRDSFKSGNDDFWRYVSRKLNDRWAEVAKKYFEGLDTWGKFIDRDRGDKKALFRAFDHFAPAYGKNAPDNIQAVLEDKFGVTVPIDVCEKLDRSRRKVEVVKVNHASPQKKRATRSKKIWEVIHEAPDGVYIAKSPSKKKCSIAWGLGDTHVVRVGDYDKYESNWGWEKLKELPNFNLAEKLPNLDPTVIAKYDGSRGGTAGGSGGGVVASGDGRDPSTYTLKVRRSTGASKYYSAHNAEDLKETLEDDGTFSMGRLADAEYLVIRHNDETARSAASHASKKKNVAATRLPKYVYNYFEGTKNVYESYDELAEDQCGATITIDGTKMDLEDIPSSYCLINTGSEEKNHFDDPERLVEVLGYDTSKWTTYAYVDYNEFYDTWGSTTDAKVIKTANGGDMADFEDYGYKSNDFDELYKEDMLSGMDKDSEEYKFLFGHRYGEATGSDLKTAIGIAEKAGLIDDQ